MAGDHGLEVEVLLARQRRAPRAHREAVADRHDAAVGIDELDLDPGVAKLKVGGGHGGHNGLRDIISCLGNNKNFGRLRIGIGHPGDRNQVVDYVLKRPSREEERLMRDAIGRGVEEIPAIVSGDLQKAMNRLH